MKSNGFTLIEMLTVVAVLGILVGLLSPVIMQANRQAKIAKTKATIAKLELALDSYKNDHSEYPQPDASRGNLNVTSGSGVNLFYYLSDMTRPATRSSGGHEYLTMKEADKNADNQLIDPWNRPYVVFADDDDDSTTEPPHHNLTTFDIYSKGPNGTTTGADNSSTAGEDVDDINNWSRE